MNNLGIGRIESFFNLAVVGIVLCVVLVSCGGNTPEEMFLKGYRALQDGDFIAAALYFDKFLEKYPEDKYAPKAHLLLAECRARLGDGELALKEYKMVTRKYPETTESVDATFQIGRYYAMKQRPVEAESEFLKLLEGDIEKEVKVAALFEAARAYIAASSAPEKAEAFLRQALEMDDQPQLKLNALFEIARGYIACENYMQAVKPYEEIVKDASFSEENRGLALLYLGECYQRAKQLDKSLEVWSRLEREFDGTDAARWSFVKQASAIAKQQPAHAEQLLEQAVQSYRAIIDASPEEDRSAWAHMKIAEAYREVDNVTAAIEAYEQVIARFPNMKNYSLPAKEVINLLRQKIASNTSQEVQSVQEATMETAF